MTTPYYQDENVTLYHGDSLEILPTLDVKADVLLTDPPYFKVKQEEWDNQWDKASEFLGWMGDFLDAAKPLLTPQASVWVFASPAMTSSVERLVGDRFRVLNSIRWAKLGGDNLRRVSLPTMRRFVTIWEGIVFAEQYAEGGGVDHVGHKDAFKTAGQYLHAERIRAGLSRPALACVLAELGAYSSVESAQANISLQELGARKLSPKAYSAWSSVVPLKPYSDLLADYERMGVDLHAARRPFAITERKMSEDIWHFHSVHHRPGKHPCEKPRDLLAHMIETSSRPGDLILDPFAGSGSTLLAASRAGRRAVGIEKDERWCEHAANRLSAETLDIFGAAA